MRRAALAALLAAGCATPTVHLPAPGALGPYSAGVEAGGLVFLSGKVAAPERRGGDFAAEAASALDAVEADLARLGLGLGDVVSATVHLLDLGDYATLNAVWSGRVPPPWPARTCVAVAGLPGGARLEVTVTARRR